eukprot:gene8902-13805_t
MAEQLGFHQGFGKRAAVHGHEGPVAPGAEVVDMARHQLFTGAGFADDQHAGFAGRDLLDVRQQRLGFGVFEDLGRGADRGRKSGRGR